MAKIILQEMEFYSHHGVMPEEKSIGARYLINLSLDGDYSDAMHTDRLKDTVNYYDVYHVVKKEMEKPSKLIEHVAGRIIEVVFEKFKQVSAITIAITKINPPVDGNLQKVTFEATKEKYGW